MYVSLMNMYENSSNSYKIEDPLILQDLENVLLEEPQEEEKNINVEPICNDVLCKSTILVFAVIGFFLFFLIIFILNPLKLY